MLQYKISANAIKLGRDGFLKLLRKYNLTVKPRKKWVYTTQSKHRFSTYKNLIKEYQPGCINQLFVADITYLRVGRSFAYLSLVVDAFSRRIMGYSLSDNLGTASTIKALKQALRKLRFGDRLIHHSDRGIQYCCDAYISILKKHNIEISMSGKGNPYENGLMERVNGSLKYEFQLKSTFKNFANAKKAVDSAIGLYNSVRLHWGINLETPDSVYFGELDSNGGGADLANPSLRRVKNAHSQDGLNQPLIC